MELFWICPDCNIRVDFLTQMKKLFDEDGDALFEPERGVCFHIIQCKCGKKWVMDMETLN